MGSRSAVRAGRRRKALLASFTLAGGLISPIVLAPSAHASVASECHGQDRSYRSIYGVKKKFTLTHSNIRDLPAHASMHRSVTISVTNVLKASSNFHAEMGGSADWAFAKLEAKVGVDLASEGSHTKTTTTSERIDIKASSHRRAFVFYEGRQLVQARWRVLTCSRAPGHGTLKTGPVKSYYGERGGAILCGHSRYKKNSHAYLVTLQAGC
jgi:hypothetical protein